MPNRNRRRRQRQNREESENQRSRSPTAERRNDNSQEASISRTEPRHLRTWDDLVAERQRQAAPQVRSPAPILQNEEINDNRPWADIVEEELYHTSANQQEQAAGHRHSADMMDDEMNPQAPSTMQAPAVQDDLQYNVPINAQTEDIVEEAEQMDVVLNEDIINEEQEQEQVDMIINENIEGPIAPAIEDHLVEDAFALPVSDGEQDNLGSPVQAPASLIESDEDESDNNDYDPPIVWADILDLELQDDDLSVTSNPGRHHTEENSEHPLSTTITETELGLLPPPLLPVITHELQAKSKDNQKHRSTVDGGQIEESSISQNQQQCGKPQGSEVDKPIQILWADEVEAEQRTKRDNRTKTPAENVSRSSEENLHSGSTKTCYPDSASANQPGRASKNQEKSLIQFPAKIIYVKDLERVWKLAAFHKQNQPKDNLLLGSPVKSSADKKIEEHVDKDVKQQKVEANLPSIFPTLHEKCKLEEKSQEKQKIQWSNLVLDNKTVVDNKQFPILGSTKFQTHRKTVESKQPKYKNNELEQPIVQSTPLARAPTASNILPNNDAVATRNFQKKKPRIQWSTFKTTHDEKSSDQQFRNTENPQQASSTWTKPYYENRPYNWNTRDRQQNRDDGNFRQGWTGRPWAERQYPTTNFPQSKAPRPFRVQRRRWGQTEYPIQRSDYQQRYERGWNTQNQNPRNDEQTSRPENPQTSRRGSENHQQYERHEERSGKPDDQGTHWSNSVSQAQPSKFITKKDDYQVQDRNDQTKLSESPLREDTVHPTPGSAKMKSISDTYVSPLKTPKSQSATKGIHDSELQKSKPPTQLLKRSPTNVSKQYAKTNDNKCSLTIHTQTTKQGPQIHVTTVECGMQTEDVCMTDQSVETVSSNEDNIYEDPGTNTEEIASNIGQRKDIAIAIGSKLSALSLEFVPERRIEVVNLKLKFKDSTVVEDDFIPEPVAPLHREDGSVDPAAELQYLHEKREYFQARCRKLIIKHYPNEDISSKRPNETYEGMYNRLMEEETQRLYSKMRTEASASSLSTNVESTTEIAEQQPPSSGEKESKRETKAEVKIPEVPQEKDKQTTVPDNELVESEQVLYPEYFWKNDEDANRILDEQEFQEIDWSTPKSRKRSKSKKVRSTDRQTEVTDSNKEITDRAYYWKNYVEANRILNEQEMLQTDSSTPESHQRSKSEKSKNTDRQSKIASSEKNQSPQKYSARSTPKSVRSVPDLRSCYSDGKPKERKVNTDIVDKAKIKSTHKQYKAAGSKKASVCRNLEAQFKRISSVPQEAKSKQNKMPVPSLDNFAMELEEIKSEKSSDDDVSAELSPPSPSKSNKRTKSKGKKTEEVTVSVSETVDVSEEEILIEPVPPTPMADGYIDPEDQKMYQQERHEYFEARCRLLIKKYYPTVDINSKHKKESYEGMYKRLLSEEAKSLVERNKKSEKYFQKQKKAADQEGNKLKQNKVTPEKSPRIKTKSKVQKKKSVAKAVSVPKSPELQADIKEKDDSSTEDPIETLSTSEEFVSADDENTSSSNSPKQKIKKQYKTRKNIPKNIEVESESEPPVSVHMFVLPKQANKTSGDKDNDNLLESDPPSLFFTPTESLLETGKQAQTKSVPKEKSEIKGKNKQRPKLPKRSDESDLPTKPQTIDGKHVQFVEKVHTVRRVDGEEKLPGRYPEPITDSCENNSDHLQDEAAAFPLSELESRKLQLEAKRKSQKKKAISAGEEMVVSEGSEPKQVKSCPVLPVTGQVKLTKSQRKRANAKKKALLVKKGEGDTVKKGMVHIVCEEPKPPVPDEFGFINPLVQMQYEREKKEYFQAKCMRLILRDYPKVDLNSKLANETYEQMYNRLLREERLCAERYFEVELRKLDALKEKFNKYKSKKK